MSAEVPFSRPAAAGSCQGRKAAVTLATRDRRAAEIYRVLGSGSELIDWPAASLARAAQSAATA